MTDTFQAPSSSLLEKQLLETKCIAGAVTLHAPYLYGV